MILLLINSGNLSTLKLLLSDLARDSEAILSNGLNNPGPLTILIVFSAGFLTSLGPCSLSLLPVTVAYLGGFKDENSALKRSIIFCSGIVLALVCLGSISGLLGNIYGQIPSLIPIFVAVLAIIMGLNLLGFVKFPLPQGPDPDVWKQKVPNSLAPLAAGMAFGLASSPCSTPIIAVLLGWIATNGNPISGIVLLASFGVGQVIPLLIAGTAVASIQNLLFLRPVGRWIPPISGIILVSTGLLTLMANWI